VITKEAVRSGVRACGVSRTRKVQGVTLVIKVTAGENDPERCNQAFTVAAAAIASGVDVSLWLTGESAWFALPGRAAEFKLPHAAPLEDLLGSVLAAGTVTLCTQCAARRSITPDDLIEGIRIAGAPTFVAEVMADDAKALVY
jgi:predicted peroxiredoxin